nr:hypothetical protein [Halegenticoccus soli]
MRPIRFEAADSRERTQIGEGLTRPAVKAGRLETGRKEGKYFLRHDDGCAACGAPVEPGEPFYLDPETGEILCEEHGRERRGESESGENAEVGENAEGGPDSGVAEGTDGSDEEPNGSERG